MSDGYTFADVALAAIGGVMSAVFVLMTLEMFGIEPLSAIWN